uniref:hypothetical protein n=1 Tax=Rhodococcus ruber TaxID=1830 RepID=UPI001D186C08|nr:hypothetical protein [Rhodococcus ruber]
MAGWRAQAMVESPSHLRAHSRAKTLTLLAALLHTRHREVTDALVDLLIATVHRVGARAERRVTEELVNAFRRVTGKENILFSIADAALAAPDEAVREVVFPAVSGGEQTLRELVHEYKTKGPVYQRTVKTTLRASYTNHYRADWSGCWRCCSSVRATCIARSSTLWSSSPGTPRLGTTPTTRSTPTSRYMPGWAVTGSRWCGAPTPRAGDGRCA